MMLYQCDPEKNANCSKRGCKAISGDDFGGVCELTSNPEYAKLDADGNPLTVDVPEPDNEE